MGGYVLGASFVFVVVWPLWDAPRVGYAEYESTLYKNRTYNALSMFLALLFMNYIIFVTYLKDRYVIKTGKATLKNSASLES